MKIQGYPTVGLAVTIVLTEAEAGALDAIAGYGADNFLKVFYQHLGESYLQPYEAGLRSLFESARREIPGLLVRADQARKCFIKVEFERLAEVLGEPAKQPLEPATVLALGELREFVETYVERCVRMGADPGGMAHNRAVVRDFLRDFEEHRAACVREATREGA
jgi:hypothetical protein